MGRGSSSLPNGFGKKVEIIGPFKWLTIGILSQKHDLFELWNQIITSLRNFGQHFKTPLA